MGGGKVCGTPEDALTTIVARVEAASESFHVDLTLLENRFPFSRHRQSWRRA